MRSPSFGDVDEGLQARAFELLAVVVVHLEVQRVFGDEREEEALVVKPPPAEHRLGGDRAELAHRLDDVLDEIVPRLLDRCHGRLIYTRRRSAAFGG
jgi:hypothetical protein